MTWNKWAKSQLNFRGNCLVKDKKNKEKKMKYSITGAGALHQNGAIHRDEVGNQDLLLNLKCPLNIWGFPGGASGNESAYQCRRCKWLKFDPWVRKISWRRAWQPTPVFLPGESHRQRSLVGYSLWGPKESDRAEVTLARIALDIQWRQQVNGCIYMSRSLGID